MRRELWLPLAGGLLALALYTRTLVPGVFVADFAEFQYLPARLGLAHPNGFPFYMLLGKLWSGLPVGTLAWRMNFLSAVAGALAVGLTIGFVRRLTGRALPGVVAGGLLALSPTFWLYSLAAERYTLNLALLVAALWAAWEAGEISPRRRGGRGGYAEEGERDEEILPQERRGAGGEEISAETQGCKDAEERVDTSPLPGSPAPPRILRAPRASAVKLSLLSSLLLGLGLATHPSDALLLPFWLAFLWWKLPDQRWSWRFWLGLGAVGAAVQMLYLYVPWRWLAFSDAPLLPGIERSAAIHTGLVHVWYEPGPRWELMRQYVLGLSGYATELAGGGWGAALARSADLLPFWLADVPWLVTVAGLAGLLWLARREWSLSLLLAGFAGLLFVMVAYIQQGKNDAYLLPAFWVAFVGAGLAADLLLTQRRRGAEGQRGSGEEGKRQKEKAKGVVLWMGTAVGLAWLGVSGWGRLDYSRWDESGRWWAQALALPLEAGAGLVGHWSDLTPLWYIQQAEGVRPDLVGLFPPDPDAIVRPWLETGRSLYLAGPLHGWAETLADDFRLTAWGGLVRIDLPAGPPPDCPLDGPPLETPAAWPFAVSAWRLETPADPADPPRLWLCWQARTPLPRRTFLSLRLAPAGDGSALHVETPLIAPWHPQPVLAEGSSGLALLPLDLPPGRAPGAYALTAQPFFFREEDGQAVYWPGVDGLALGSLELAGQTELVWTDLTDEFAPPLPLRAGPVKLRAWQVSRQAVRPGDPVRVETLWQTAAATDGEMSLWLGVRDGWGRLVKEQRWPLPVAALPPGTLLRTEQILAAPRSLGDRSFWIEARLLADDAPLGWFPTARLLLGRMKVADRSHVYAPPAGIEVAEAEFGGLARLHGFALESDTLATGAPLALSLYWQAQAETDTSYKVFLHLVGPEGELAAQNDAIPAAGELPTNLWVSGEVIADRHSLTLPDALPPGVYRLLVGLYDPTSGERLPVVGGGPERAVELARFVVE